MKLLVLFFIAMISCGKLAAAELSAEFARGDFENAYQENQYNLGLRLNLGDPKYKMFAGYGYTDRNYRELVHLYKNAFTLGGSIEAPSLKSYFEFSAMTSDSDLIGARNQYTFTPHSTAIKDFDLGLGLIYSNFSTGDIFSVSPQILYFLNDNWIFGFTSWSFNDDGWHFAWRGFVRAHQSKWSEELSVAGGETREDIGVIDTFTSYGGNIKYHFNSMTMGLLAERYEGELRKGWQGGVQVTCPF